MEIKNGTRSENDAIESVNKITPNAPKDLSTMVANLYISSRCIPSIMANVSIAYLQKQLSLAKVCISPEFNGESDNIKRLHLLLNSQLDTKNQLVAEANVSIVEAIINNLTNAVNGDVEPAHRLLAKLYGALKNTKLAGFIPAGM